MASVEPFQFILRWLLLLIPLTLVWPIHTSPKRLDPRGSLVCSTNQSLTLIDVDRAELVQFTEPWQQTLAHIQIAPGALHTGNFSVVVGKDSIVVFHTLYNSPYTYPLVIDLPMPVEVVFSLVSGETLVYTTKEATWKGLVTYKTYALDLANVFQGDASAELLEGDNCTVTQQLAPGEWIVACSNALFWYRGSVSDRVRIPWLDGTANEQQCFSGHPQVGPVTELTLSTPPTLPVTCSMHAPCDTGQWKSVAIVALVVVVVVSAALIGVILILCGKLHRLPAKGSGFPIALEPDPPVANSDSKDRQDSHSQLSRDDDATSVASTSSYHRHLPTPFEISVNSLESIQQDCSQPHTKSGTYRLTYTGIFRSSSALSFTNVSSSSTASHPSVSEASPAVMESSEGDKLHAAVSLGFPESDATFASEQGDPRKSESTLPPSTRVRTPESGCSQH